MLLVSSAHSGSAPDELVSIVTAPQAFLVARDYAKGDDLPRHHRASVRRLEVLALRRWLRLVREADVVPWEEVCEELLHKGESGKENGAPKGLRRCPGKTFSVHLIQIEFSEFIFPVDYSGTLHKASFGTSY